MKNLFPMRLSVFVYLFIRRSLDDKSYITLHDLVVSSGYKPDKNKNGINRKFVTILDTMEGLEYFIKEFGEYSGYKVCILQLNSEKFDTANSFAIVSLNELQKMREYKSKLRNVSYDKLLLILCYIRVNKLRRSEYQQNNAHKKKPEFFYRQIKTIADDTALSPKTVSACITALESLNIIVSRPMPRYKDKYDNWHTDVTLFVDKTGNWEDELKWGEEFLLNNKALHEDSVQTQLY
ncbi:MAG: hypothetical protein RR806_06210 [Oscillospiraceae bacterium]